MSKPAWAESEAIAKYANDISAPKAATQWKRFVAYVRWRTYEHYIRCVTSKLFTHIQTVLGAGTDNKTVVTIVDRNDRPCCLRRMNQMKIMESEILKARILIVDDQESNVLLLQQVLSEAGYTNFASTMNPQEVCALHHKQKYDLILLDLQMPVMDGFAVMECLKANAQDGYLPVLVITAQPGHKLRALLAGARDFISKPLDLVEVRTRIRNMLEVRLLYKKLEDHNENLEQTLQERTAELRESEARYRSLTELASDWYWEQDVNQNFTKVSGPVLDMLGIQVGSLAGEASGQQSTGWNKEERELLQAKIAARQPFLDFVFSRVNTDGSTQRFQVSGEPMFTQSCRLIGYRCIGVELTVKI